MLPAGNITRLGFGCLVSNYAFVAPLISELPACGCHWLASLPSTEMSHLEFGLARDVTGDWANVLKPTEYSVHANSARLRD